MASPVQCPLCGNEFDADAKGCHSSCPLSEGCRVVCCPACAYSFPREDKGLAGAIRRLVTLRRARS